MWMTQCTAGVTQPCHSLATALPHDEAPGPSILPKPIHQEQCRSSHTASLHRQPVCSQYITAFCFTLHAVRISRAAFPSFASAFQRSGDPAAPRVGSSVLFARESLTCLTFHVLLLVSKNLILIFVSIWLRMLANDE